MQYFHGDEEDMKLVKQYLRQCLVCYGVIVIRRCLLVWYGRWCSAKEHKGRIEEWS